MKRRSFLAGALGAAPAVARDRRELGMVTAWPVNTPGVGVNARRFADEVASMSGGRLRIRVYGAGEIVPAFEALDAVSGGTVDMAHSSPYYWVGKSPAFNYFTGVPFGLLAGEHAAWIHFGGGQGLWDSLCAEFGVVPFYAGSSGAQAGGWFNREINTVEDFKGLKFRIAGLGGEVMRRLGATTVTTPPGEIASALMSGAVDGADWVGPWNDLAFGLHRFARYYYMPGFHEPGPGLEVLVRKATWEGLPGDLQAIVRAAAGQAAHRTLADFQYHNTVSYRALVAEHGVSVRRFPDAVVRRLGQVTREVLEEVAGRDPFTARVHASYMGYLRQAAAYAPHAEEGTLAMRRQVLAARVRPGD